MSRDIFVQPCVPTSLPSVTVPMMAASISAQGSLSSSTDCAGCEVLGGLMTQLGPMFGALGVPVCLLSCVGSVINAVKAVPDSLGPPPDPTALIQAIAEMISKCSCVVEIALPPPVGIICGFLKMTSDLVTVAASVLACGTAIVTDITVVQLRATTLSSSPVPALAAQGAYLGTQAQKLMDTFNVKLQPLSVIFSMIQPVFDLLSAVVPPPFNATISAVLAGFSAFTSATPPGTDPAVFLTALTTLSGVMSTAATAFASIVSVCP